MPDVPEKEEVPPPTSTTKAEGWRSGARRFVDELQRWQNLTSAMIALFAATVAWGLTQRQISVAQDQLAVATSQANSAQQQLIIAAQQARSAQEQLAIAARQADYAQKQMLLAEEGQRPIMWPNVESHSFVSRTMDRISWNWNAKNLGKTSALSARYEVFWKASNGQFEKSDMNSDGEFELVPPDDSNSVTAISRRGIGARDYARLLAARDSISFAVRIRYKGPSGRDYEISRCFAETGGSEAVANCKATLPQ